MSHLHPGKPDDPSKGKTAHFWPQIPVFLSLCPFLSIPGWICTVPPGSLSCWTGSCPSSGPPTTRCCSSARWPPWWPSWRTILLTVASNTSGWMVSAPAGVEGSVVPPGSDSGCPGQGGAQGQDIKKDFSEKKWRYWAGQKDTGEHQDTKIQNHPEAKINL